MSEKINSQFIKIYKSDLKLNNLTLTDIVVLSVLKNELNITRLYNNENFITTTDKKILSELNNLISFDTLRRSINKLKKNNLILTEKHKDAHGKYYRTQFKYNYFFKLFNIIQKREKFPFLISDTGKIPVCI